MSDAAAKARRDAWGRGWRTVAGGWGPPGNERLTTSLGLVLLVLLGIETLTTLALHAYLPVHIFLGLLLIPPVALKLASTGWKFLRYYTNSKPYRVAGPPRLLLRLLAPFLVASTLTLFGSGVLMIIVGHGGGPLLQLHALSFAVWGVLMAIHILAYLTRALRVGVADWRRHATLSVAGSHSRRGALAGALLAGLILALATYPAQQSWLRHRSENRGDDGLSQAPAVAIQNTAP
jgi:hypothetical protein